MWTGARPNPPEGQAARAQGATDLCEGNVASTDGCLMLGCLLWSFKKSPITEYFH